VNDLDLVVTDPNGIQYRPWVLDHANPADVAVRAIDTLNNMEQVTVENPIEGEWTIRVEGTSIPYPVQPYSIVSNAFFWTVFNPVDHQSNYNDDPRYSAAAVSSMIINKLADIDPSDPVTPRSQSDVITFIEDYTGVQIPASGSTSENVQSMLEQFTGDGNCYQWVDTDLSGPDVCAPSSVGGAYNWTLFKKTDVNNLLYDIAYWQLQNEYAAAIPTNGDYSHWVTIEGVSADVPPIQNPYPDNYPTGYPLRGFFIDDPGESGGSAKSFKVAKYWIDPNEGYFLPTDGAYYEAVVEPPATEGSVTLTEDNQPPLGNTSSGPGLQDRARQSIAEMRLIANRNFSQAYTETSAGTPILINRTDNGSDFYLVPFLKDDGRISVVTRLNAENGQLMEAAYNYNTEEGIDYPIDPTQPFDPALILCWATDSGHSAFHPTSGDVLTQDITVQLDANGNASIVANDIDAGSSAPCGIASLTLDQTEFTCSDLGENTVTLTVTDNNGNTNSATATVTVEDTLAPANVQANAPATIIPPDAPISFTATAEDNCSVNDIEITDYFCYKIKKDGSQQSKMDGCAVSLSGDTITITDSGGVDDNITWTVLATDQSGNTTKAEGHVLVVNPGRGKGK
jgi:hypothetical protein